MKFAIALLLPIVTALKNCPREKGFCVKKNNQDENSGVIKVNSVNGNSVDAQKICMAACLKHKGATGCEVIWDQNNRGCYIHTSTAIDHGNRVAHHNCWIFSKCTEEADETEYQKFSGWCATPDKKDLNYGESHAGSMDLARCHKLCEDSSQCTAYQYNGKSPKGDCWIHTSPSVGGGTGNTIGKCYIKRKPGSTCSQFCQEWMDSSPSAEKGCKGADCGHQGCLDPSCGENQYLSCAQACDARAHGATEKQCLSVCNGPRQCTLHLAGKSYDACSDCDEHQGFTNECHVGSRSGCQFGCTAFEASTGTDHGSLVNCRSREFEQCLHNCVPVTFTPLNDASTSADWKLNRGDLIVRTCPDCVATHRVIVYKRLSAAGSIDYKALFWKTWRDSMPGGDNKLNTDFALYSSVEDAQANKNPWKFCNYNDEGIGFPRDCGPTGSVGGQWNSMTRGGHKVRFQRGRQDATGGAATNPCVLCLGSDMKIGTKDDNPAQCKRCPKTCKPSCGKFVGCLDLDTLQGKYYEIGDRVVIGGDEACVVSAQKGTNGQNVFGVNYHDGLTSFEIVRPDEMRMVKKKDPECIKSKTNMNCRSALAKKCRKTCNTPICVECMGIDFKFGTTDDNGKACNMCPQICHTKCEPFLECTLDHADCKSAEASLCKDQCSDSSCIESVPCLLGMCSAISVNVRCLLACHWRWCIGEDGKLFTDDDNKAACRKCPGGVACGTSCAPYIKCLEREVDCSGADARKCANLCDDDSVMEKIDTDGNNEISAAELARMMARSDYEGLLRSCKKSCRACENCRRSAAKGSCKASCPDDAAYNRAHGVQCSTCVQQQCSKQCADPDKPDFCSICKTDKKRCPKMCTGKNDPKNPCLEIKGVGGALVADSDCCAEPSAAGCKSGFQYSKGDVCYRTRTFVAYKTVCTAISESKKNKCEGKVWNFGDFFVDTSVDHQATCTNNALAVTDLKTCEQVSQEYQRVCGTGRIEKRHNMKKYNWDGPVGCYFRIVDRYNGHTDKHVQFNSNKNGHGAKSHFPVCYKQAPVVVVHGRNLRSDADEIAEEM